MVVNFLSLIVINCCYQLLLLISHAIIVLFTFSQIDIVSRAESLQSIIQLMGEKDLYDYHSGTYKVNGIGWSQEKATQIITAWQRSFTQVPYLTHFHILTPNIVFNLEKVSVFKAQIFL